MDLPNETQGQGQRIQPFQAVLQGLDVIDDLFEIIGGRPDGRARLGGEQLLEGCPGAFDPARQHRFPAKERADEKMGIGKAPALAREPADRPVSARERGDEFGVPCDRRSQRRRHEGGVAAWALHVAAVQPAARIGGHCDATLLVCENENSARFYYRIAEESQIGMLASSAWRIGRWRRWPEQNGARRKRASW